MISEEKLIEQMKKRKRQIVGLCIIIVILCVVMVIGGIFIEKGLDRIEDTDYWAEAVVETQNVPEAWAQLFSSCAMLAFTTSKIYILIMAMAVLLGVVISIVIAEMMGWRHTRLLVVMWERLGRLEKGVQEQAEENV